MIELFYGSTSLLQDDVLIATEIVTTGQEKVIAKRPETGCMPIARKAVACVGAAVNEKVSLHNTTELEITVIYHLRSNSELNWTSLDWMHWAGLDCTGLT